MKIESLVVRNFRAITQLELTDLQNSIVIAGPNGCGKSCVFDAIRLLKSAYGGYQPNEWESWFGEFQIRLSQDPRAMMPLLQDKSRSLEVLAELSLAPSERLFVEQNAADLLEEQVWRRQFPEMGRARLMGGASVARERALQPEVSKEVAGTLPELRDELQRSKFTARLIISPDARPEISPSRLLELVFSLYRPQSIGIIDYHGAARNYAREQVGGINLNLESTEQRLKQHALYNSANKYANLKTEMASVFVKQLLQNRALGSTTEDDDLTATLKELFSTFFPGKEFLGPTPTTEGTLRFPVRTDGASEPHDIDDLSLGEKEVLYGYLRLRSSAPRNSIILIDEPELHLNPRLVAGLASFYYRHLGQAMNNQLWLVTHSDTLIREAVAQPGYSVFHMQPPARSSVANQVTPVRAIDEIESVVIDLVGDLAAYRPGAKIVVFEGGGSAEFDVRMTLTLFPDFALAVNAISGGDKKRVADLYQVLEDARAAGRIPMKFYAITDGDGATVPTVARHLQWDTYHIENYLLEPSFVLRVLDDLNAVTSQLNSADAVHNALRACAELTVPELVAHHLRATANKVVMPCEGTGFFRPKSE